MMPIHAASTYFSGLLALETLPTTIAVLFAVLFVKRWSGGVDVLSRLDRQTAQAEADGNEGRAALKGGIQRPPRNLHGTVAIVVGGFTSQGLLVCSQLSSLGAQLILLTPSVRSSRVVQLVHLLRDGTSNPLIYAEECDVTSIASIEAFAAQWNLGDGAERLMGGPGTELAGGVGALGDVGLTAKTQKQDKSLPSLAAASAGGKTGVAPRRVDSIVFLPLDEARYAIRSPTRRTAEQVEVSHAEILGRFHLVNLLLPSLLLLPPNRDIRIISLLSPWYAAGVHSYDQNERGKKSSPWINDGCQSLLWLALSREIQRRIQLLTEADQRPRTKLPGIDDEGNVAGKALLSNVNMINVCAGFERGRDVLDYILPGTGISGKNDEWEGDVELSGRREEQESKLNVNGNAELKALVDPRLKSRKSDKYSKEKRRKDGLRQLQDKLPSQSWPSQSLVMRICSALQYALVVVFWPLAWLLCKSPKRSSETVTWASVAPIHTYVAFNQSLDSSAVVPGELHREGRIVRPPLPDSLIPGEPIDSLWTKMEAEAKAALSVSSAAFS